MGRVTSGVFPVHENVFKVKVDEEFVPIANLEGFSVSFDGTVENWNAMENGGWESALKTGMKWGLTLKGKRTIGDPGNDYIAEKRFAMGQDAYADIQWTMPTGTQITQQVVVNVKSDGTGDTTNVGALEAELQSNGKPEVSTATET